MALRDFIPTAAVCCIVVTRCLSEGFLNSDINNVTNTKYLKIVFSKKIRRLLSLNGTLCVLHSIDVKLGDL